MGKKEGRMYNGAVTLRTGCERRVAREFELISIGLPDVECKYNIPISIRTDNDERID